MSLPVRYYMWMRVESLEIMRFNPLPTLREELKLIKLKPLSEHEKIQMGEEVFYFLDFLVLRVFLERFVSSSS